MSIPKFNPYTIDISFHAKKRFIERYMGKNVNVTTKPLLNQAEDLMREMMFEICTSIPLMKHNDDRKHFMLQDSVFVISKECDIVVTFYTYVNLPKSRVKQIRKSII